MCRNTKSMHEDKRIIIMITELPSPLHGTSIYKHLKVQLKLMSCLYNKFYASMPQTIHEYYLHLLPFFYLK